MSGLIHKHDVCHSSLTIGHKLDQVYEEYGVNVPIRVNHMVREMAAVMEEFRNTLNEKQSLAVVNTVV